MIDGFRRDLIASTGFKLGVNYGWNKVRFPAPVPAGVADPGERRGRLGRRRRRRLVPARDPVHGRGRGQREALLRRRQRRPRAARVARGPPDARAGPLAEIRGGRRRRRPRARRSRRPRSQSRCHRPEVRRLVARREVQARRPGEDVASMAAGCARSPRKTGLAVRADRGAGLVAGTATARGVAKLVRWWLMRPLERRRSSANDEVDELRWVPLRACRRRASTTTQRLASSVAGPVR